MPFRGDFRIDVQRLSEMPPRLDNAGLRFGVIETVFRRHLHRVQRTAGFEKGDRPWNGVLSSRKGELGCLVNVSFLHFLILGSLLCARPHRPRQSELSQKCPFGSNCRFVGYGDWLAAPKKVASDRIHL